MSYVQKNRMFSIFSSLILCLSLILSPMQVTSYAEAIADENESNNEELTNDSQEDTENGEENKDLNNEQEESLDEPTTNDENDNETEATESEQQNVTEGETKQEEKISTNVATPDDENEDEDEEKSTIEITKIETDKTSGTVHWTVHGPAVEYVYIYLDYNFYKKVPGNTTSYTFSDLTTGEYSTVCLKVDKDEPCEYHEYVEFTPYWPEEELYPFTIIAIPKNGEFGEYDSLDINGIDDHNKALYITDYDMKDSIFSIGNDLFVYLHRFELPAGNYEVVFYNLVNPTISEKHQIEITDHFDHEYSPFTFEYDLQQLRSEAEPFHYEVTEITENSFTVKWTETPKVERYRISGYDTSLTYHYSYDIEKGTEEFTITDLPENLTYEFDLIVYYDNGLFLINHFKIKTDGEDADAEVVQFKDDSFQRLVAKQVGALFRDITTVDLNLLEYLYIDEEEIDSDEVSISGIEHAKNIDNLRIEHKFIRDLEVLSLLTSLTVLSIKYGMLEFVEALETLTNLTILELSNNNIRDISKLINLTNLEQLDLSKNEIESLSALADMENLNELKANANKISDLHGLENLSNLQQLHLVNNAIENIDALKHLTALEFLSLKENAITTIPDLSALTNLQKLELQGNNITNISGIKDLASLEILSLCDNEIKELPESISSLTNLQELCLEYNFIEDISVLTNLTNLEKLYLGGNNLQSLPDFSSLNKLKELTIFGTAIEDISGLKNNLDLRVLAIEESNVKDISPLRDLTKLKHLYLYGNMIEDISSLSGLENLESLSLVDNDVSSIEAIRSLTNLRYLYLTNNPVSDIAAVSGLNSLIELDLSLTNVTDLSPLLDVPTLQVLYLDERDDLDKGVIEQLRANGVDVIFTEETDYLPWVDQEIDVEGVHDAFPARNGFDVSEDGKLITYDISEGTTFELSTKQLKVLTNREQTIQISHDGEIILEIPASVFGMRTQPITLNIEEVENGPATSVSKTYNLEIIQGPKYINKFSDKIALTFKVDMDRVTNPDDLHVHYYNEQTESWEMIEGTVYNGDGTVTVETNHFSRFTVIEVAAEEKPGVGDEPGDEETPGDDSELGDEEGSDTEDTTTGDIDDSSQRDDDESDVELVKTPDDRGTVAISTVTEEAGKGGQLPKTATNTYLWILTGFIFLAAGFATFILRVRKTRTK